MKNFSMPLKDWVGYASMLIAMTASYVLTNANQEKNNALTNQKLDTLIMNQQASGQQLNSQQLIVNNHEVRITVLEKTKIVPLLSQADLEK